MKKLTLYIGNKNYSSWSMRPFLVLRKGELPFTEEQIQLDVPGYKEKLLAISDAGTVPVLKVGDEIIPDSLDISDWAALCVPNLWPKDPKDREAAIALCVRMQEEFGALRENAPMNLRRRTRSTMPDECLAEAEEMSQIWTEHLSSHNGAFLFNEWSIADAFSTPYATRFVSYDLPRSDKADAYISELMLDEHFLEWEADAMIEPWELPKSDAVNR